jgi:glycosyltransferase involved in cell wall biosynthesis
MWRDKDITVLICQRNTKDLIRLSLESLLRFYPDIPILIMEGGSTDDSISYLEYKTLLYPNITIVQGTDTTSNFTSHGVTMDNALNHHIKTSYTLLMDSDVIIERGGFIEDMLEKMKNRGIYAMGSLMLPSRANYGCAPPKDKADEFRYAHPSFSIYDTQMYISLEAPFNDNGAPCAHNMLEAEKKGLSVEYYPIDKYVTHLSGGSWTEPRTIWANDHSVYLRPLVTFVVESGKHIDQLKMQNDHDFDVVIAYKTESKFIVIHGQEPKTVSNGLYNVRFNVTGEYICYIKDSIEEIQPEFMRTIKTEVIRQQAPDELVVGGVRCVKRTVWQKLDSTV